MKFNWSDARYVLVALTAAIAAILSMGLVQPPASQWLTVIVTVVAALVGSDNSPTPPQSPTTP